VLPSRPRDARVVLIGMMGSGKSSVGRALAGATGWEFVDNDALVERATGRTARELLAERGEDAMRDAESAALHAGLSLPPPVIVAVAAGTVLDPDDRARLAAEEPVVWLYAPASVLAARAVGSSHRPWLDDDPEAWFERTIEERRPLYEAVADLVVDTAVTSPDGVVEVVLGMLSTGG
jgi:shikimate kinase